jgi:hypothetical protein
VAYAGNWFHSMALRYSEFTTTTSTTPPPVTNACANVTDGYFDIVENEMGRGLYDNYFNFKPYDDEPDLYEIINGSTEEEKNFFYLL